MTLDLILFGLRLVSALVLLAILGTVFLAMWQEFRATTERLEATRRSYGRLVGLLEIDDQLMTTGSVYPLLPLTTLGRTTTNTVTIDDSFASSEHARITLRDGQWWLEDRKSRNGTVLNGVLVERPVIMTDGDIIGIGQSQFRLEID